jgi:hypothetical protein
VQTLWLWFGTNTDHASKVWDSYLPMLRQFVAGGTAARQRRLSLKHDEVLWWTRTSECHQHLSAFCTCIRRLVFCL